MSFITPTGSAFKSTQPWKMTGTTNAFFTPFCLFPRKIRDVECSQNLPFNVLELSYFSRCTQGPDSVFLFFSCFWERETSLILTIYIYILIHNQNDKFLLWLCLFLLLTNYWSDKKLTLFANNSPFSRESRLNLWQLIYLHCPFRSPASAN